MLQDFDSGIKRQREANRGAAQAAGASPPGSPRSLSSGQTTAASRGAEGGGPMSGPEALAASTDSCTLLVSFDEPPAAAATLHNVLFRTVEIASFVLAVDYIPSTVRRLSQACFTGRCCAAMMYGGYFCSMQTRRQHFRSVSILGRCGATVAGGGCAPHESRMDALCVDALCTLVLQCAPCGMCSTRCL